MTSEQTVTSEQTLRLSQSALLFSASAVANSPHKFFAGTPQSRDFCFLVTISSTSSDSEMNVDSEDSEIYYIADTKKDFTRRQPKIYYLQVFC